MADKLLETRQKKVLYVDVSGMRAPGTHGGIAEYLVRVWDARTLLFHEARAGVLTGSSRNRLGSLWLILNPLFNGMIYYIIFGLVFQTSKGIENFIGYLLIGVFMFQLTSKAITASSDSIYSGRKLVANNNLPAAVLPLVDNMKMWLSGFPSYLVMLLIILVAPPIEKLGWMSLLMIPLVGLQALLMLGFSMVAAYVVGRVYDLKNLLTVGVRAWMYASGVMFSVEKLTNVHAAFGPLVDWNPMYHVLTVARDVLLYETVPDIRSWLMIALWALCMLCLGTVLLWRGEGTYKYA